MERSELWTGSAFDADGGVTKLRGSSVSVYEGVASVIFENVLARPVHVSVRWNGSSILSATDLQKPVEKLTENPGRVVWESENSRLYFLANVAELTEICSAQRNTDKFAASS